jgi:superoxide dismutase
MENLDYEQDMKINENSLDIEWLDQAPLALKYGKHVAQLRRKYNELCEKKKTIRSELILEVNEKPGELIGKAKPNANDIEAYYRNHKRYKEAVSNEQDAAEELELAEVAKNEISFTRKAALENMVRLHAQMYFAGPSIPRDLSKEIMNKKKQEQSNAKVGKGMRRKK